MSHYKLIREVLKYNPPIVDQYIEPKVLVEGSRLFLFGSTGIGKSILAQNAAFSLAKAVPWLGLKVPKPRTTLLIQGEIPEDEFYLRSHVMAEAYGVNEDDESSPLYLWHNMDLQFTTKKGYKEICGAIEDTGCDVLIVDPLDKIMGGSASNEEDSIRARDVFDRLIADYGIAFILIHNSRQGMVSDGRKVNFGLDEARGSTILTQNWPDVSGQLIDKGDGQVLLKWEKTRFGPLDNDIKMVLNGDGLLMQTESAPKEILLGMMGKDAIGAKELKEKVGVVLGVSVRSVERYIEALISERRIKAYKNPKRRNEVLYMRIDWED